MNSQDPIDRLAIYLVTTDGTYRFLREHEYAYMRRIVRAESSLWEARIAARISAMRTALQSVDRHVNGDSERTWDFIGGLTLGDILDEGDATTMAKMLHDLTDETENHENDH